MLPCNNTVAQRCPICHREAPYGIALSDGSMLHPDCVHQKQESLASLRSKHAQITATIRGFERELNPRWPVLRAISTLIGKPRPDPGSIRQAWNAAKADLQLNDAAIDSLAAQLRCVYDFYLDYPPDWDERRAAVRMRDRTCILCGSPTDLSVHHRIGLSRGGTNRLDNLVLVCRKCHRKSHGVKEFQRTSTDRRGAFGDRVQAINQAIATRSYITFLYKKPAESQFKKRVIRPYHLLEVPHETSTEATLCVRGYCYLRKEDRTFALKRMRKLRITDSPS